MKSSRHFGLVLLLGLGGAVAAAVGMVVWLHARAPLVGPLSTGALVGAAAAAGVGLPLLLLRPRLDARDLAGFGLGVVLLAAAAGRYWDDWHEQVWIDNGTPAAVTVRFRGAPVTVIPAADQRAVTLPRVDGPLEVAGADGSILDRVDRIDLPDEEPGSDLVLNVAGAHCYRLDTGEYKPGGGVGFLARPPRPVGGRYFAVKADYLFAPLPQEIQVTQPDPRTAGLPTLRRALVIVPCAR